MEQNVSLAKEEFFRTPLGLVAHVFKIMFCEDCEKNVSTVYRQLKNHQILHAKFIYIPLDTLVVH